MLAKERDVKRLCWVVAFAFVVWIAEQARCVSVYAAETAPSSLPGFGSPWPSLLNLFFALTIVIILVTVLIRFLAKRANVQQRGSISILAARQLAPNKSVQVVEVLGKRYLLGVAESVTFIADLTDGYPTVDESDEFASTITSPFRQQLLDKLVSIRESYRPKGPKEDERAHENG